MAAYFAAATDLLPTHVTLLFAFAMGLFDVGPFVGLWFVVLSLRMLYSVRWWTDRYVPAAPNQGTQYSSPAGANQNRSGHNSLIMPK